MAGHFHIVRIADNSTTSETRTTREAAWRKCDDMNNRASVELFKVGYFEGGVYFDVARNVLSKNAPGEC